MDLRPGSKVYGQSKSDEYEIVEFINSGGFSIVYKIEKYDTKEIFALKTISTANLREKEVHALINEGKLAPTIKHQNVVDVTFFHDGLQYAELPPYIIMEYLPGTLTKVMDEKKESSEKFDNNELGAMFLQLSEGMKAINSKLIHRDIKPDNILLSKDTLKISDFGLSKVVGAATRTHTFKGVQDIRYKSPESWKLEENTIQMDVYSMGIVFYELATLESPYIVEHRGDVFEAWKNAHFFQNPEIPKTKNTRLDNNLSQLIMRMIAKRPEERYSNWDEVIRRIQAGQQEEEKTVIDVTKLVEKAIQTREQEEKARLEYELSLKKKEELEKTVQYRCQELATAFKEVVEAFNDQYEGPKITFKQAYERPVQIFTAETQKGGVVTLFVQPIYEDLEFKGQKILAWGLFKNTLGKGFNVMLLLSNPEDLYGSWICLHNTHSPMARKTDRRPDPFPFDPYEQFCEEIKVVGAIHIYQTKVSRFEKEMIPALFEDIL